MPATAAPPFPAHRLRLLETIRTSIVGDDRVIEGPFGPRRVTYADYTASGRSLSFIEDFLRDEVMPLYANTHTESSGTGRQTGRFREDARALIHRAVGGGPDDLVVFTGSGATAAINKLVGLLGLRLPAELDARWGLRGHIPTVARPVVFIGPYEHHSNELPWRESIADVVTIDEDADGHPDLAHLDAELRRYTDRPLKIGSFSAASNVTGIGSQTWAISTLLHRHGALALWDFAAAAPYVPIDVNHVGSGADAGLAYKDAVFLSPHKFIGGPGTPGVLVAKRHLFRSAVPTAPGGGTVAYVNPVEHRYLDDPVQREEAGTPAILEAIRAGLVFQLKEAVGADLIREREEHFLRRAIDAWQRHPNVRILGNLDAWRLSIVSFMVRHRDGWLHHNYVVALLNDLFGIQARGGCSCAGPYGHRLLGIDLTTSHAFEQEILRGCEGIKPGWVRVNFNYFIGETPFDFLVRAVEFIADHGWKLLPLYAFDPWTGLWRHRAIDAAPLLRLHDIRYDGGRLEYRARHATEPEFALAGYLDLAHGIVAHTVEGLERAGAEQPASPLDPPDDPAALRPLSADYRRLRWFPLPDEVRMELARAP
ncbi:MAG: aminotransferase class V-fold PLP-dependent enzyme [Myxococcales bacterium]|nr:aminotransferase class V-fold PLP-dependent enzyme [Myxococcales bacterium]